MSLSNLAANAIVASLICVIGVILLAKKAIKDPSEKEDDEFDESKVIDMDPYPWRKHLNNHKIKP